MTTDQAFILAAGLGQRMRPLTDTMPKPMLPVRGRPIIDYALDALAAEGIRRVVVNTHYCAPVLEEHLKRSKYPFDIVISHEQQLLDTGGGLKKGLGYLDAQKPVLVLSGDSILVDPQGARSLRALLDAWNGDAMDLLLLLQPLETMTLTQGVGDYRLVGGQPQRAHDQAGGYMWTSARVLHPRLFDGTPEGPFSFLSLMDSAEDAGRLGAQVHRGIWHHLSTPADIDAVNAA